MSAELDQKKKRNWISTLLKFVFFVLAFFLITFTIMFNLGGSSDIYKETIEQYIAESTGLSARIGQFNAMTFFPDLSLSFEDLELRRMPEDIDPVAGADKIYLSFKFKDVALGTGRVSDFYIENFYALPGIILNKAIQIRTAGLSDLGAGAGLLKIEGHIDQHKLEAQTNLQVLGSGDGKTYKFGKENNISIALGPVHMEGIAKRKDTGSSLDNFKALFDGQEVLTGHFEILSPPARDAHLRGEFLLSDHGTILKPDLQLALKQPPLRVSGHFSSPVFYLEDVRYSSRLMKMTDFFEQVFGPPAESRKVDVDINFTAEKFYTKSGDTGTFEKKYEFSQVPWGMAPLKQFIADFVQENEDRKSAP